MLKLNVTSDVELEADVVAQSMKAFTVFRAFFLKAMACSGWSENQESCWNLSLGPRSMFVQFSPDSREGGHKIALLWSDEDDDQLKKRAESTAYHFVKKLYNHYNSLQWHRERDQKKGEAENASRAQYLAGVEEVLGSTNPFSH